jgi:hypothetical protein
MSTTISPRLDGRRAASVPVFKVGQGPTCRWNRPAASPHPPGSLSREQGDEEPGQSADQVQHIVGAVERQEVRV